MLTLNLQAETYEELTKKVLEALSYQPPAAAVGTAAVTPTVAEEVKAEQAKTEAAADAPKKTRGKAAAKEEEAKPLISTGEPREEPAEQGNGAAAITHQDIRDLMGTYANTFGMKAVQTDGPVILSRLFGEGKVRASDIPDDTDALKKAYDALNRAIETNEFKRSLAS
jgi:hypothetical protein